MSPRICHEHPVLSALRARRDAIKQSLEKCRGELQELERQRQGIDQAMQRFADMSQDELDALQAAGLSVSSRPIQRRPRRTCPRCGKSVCVTSSNELYHHHPCGDVDDRHTEWLAPREVKAEGESTVQWGDEEQAAEQAEDPDVVSVGLDV